MHEILLAEKDLESTENNSTTHLNNINTSSFERPMSWQSSVVDTAFVRSYNEIIDSTNSSVNQYATRCDDKTHNSVELVRVGHSRASLARRRNPRDEDERFIFSASGNKSSRTT